MIVMLYDRVHRFTNLMAITILVSVVCVTTGVVWQEVQINQARQRNLSYHLLTVQSAGNAINSLRKIELEIIVPFSQLNSDALNTNSNTIARSAKTLNFGKNFHTVEASLEVMNNSQRYFRHARYEGTLKKIGRELAELKRKGEKAPLNYSEDAISDLMRHTRSLALSFGQSEKFHKIAFSQTSDQIDSYVAQRNFVVLPAAILILVCGFLLLRYLKSETNSALQRLKESDHALRQTQKMEAVGQLASGIAHDFNNILMVVQANAELLSKEIGEGVPKVDLILDAAKYGSDLIKRLLATASDQNLEPIITDVSRLIVDIEKLLTATVGEGISISTTPEPNTWYVSVDPGQLENCMLNLVINARDAMPNGGIVTIETSNVSLDDISIAGSPIKEAGDYVAVSVSDTGIGMPEDVKRRAFEPFFTTKDVGQGTGLGLSVVYGFAKHSGGFVNIFSEPGNGTTVTIYLPRIDETKHVEAS